MIFAHISTFLEMLPGEECASVPDTGVPVLLVRIGLDDPLPAVAEAIRAQRRRHGARCFRPDRQGREAAGFMDLSTTRVDLSPSWGDYVRIRRKYTVFLGE
ncbi:hypothetical protein [Streptomyces sp. NPDC060027]|uniref:hypothetical protein n=1 Tax=Streptomyces sp. NPDC060027 TaxID=3347040 RepID=UPI0036AA3854